MGIKVVYFTRSGSSERVAEKIAKGLSTKTIKITDDLNWNEWAKAKVLEVASATIVGQFGSGNSVAGASDMSGNVWEWTNSWYGTEERLRVLRGGSWIDTRQAARCTDRAWYIPINFFNVGFRVLSPGS